MSWSICKNSWLHRWAVEHNLTEADIKAFVRVASSESFMLVLTRDGRVLDPQAEYGDVLMCITGRPPVITVDVKDYQSLDDVKTEAKEKLLELGIPEPEARELAEIMMHTILGERLGAWAGAAIAALVENRD